MPPFIYNKNTRRLHLSFFFALILSVLIASIVNNTILPIHLANINNVLDSQTELKEQNNNQLLQFTSDGHVLSFDKGAMYVASKDRALKVVFTTANDVIPVIEKDESPTSMMNNNAEPFKKISYKNLWDNVTLVYETNKDSIFKSTYYINPTSHQSSYKEEVSKIKLSYNVPVHIDSADNLVLNYKTGQFTESAPIAWQDINGKRTYVDVHYVQLGEKKIGFQVGDYNTAYLLVIDPSLTWNTFLGESSGDDYVQGITTDTSGNIYVSGESSNTWGTPVRAHAGSIDAFVAKLSSAGVIIWNTFLGGGDSENVRGITVDNSGNIYVTGRSKAVWAEIPIAPNPGNGDVFAAKLSSTGTLIWHTFMGAAANADNARGITLDASDNVYVLGFSFLTWGAPVRAYTDGADTFIVKLDNNGALVWSTFIGGFHGDLGTAIAVDNSSNVYVGGLSNSTWGGPITAHAGGELDGFVAKLNSAGALSWNTFTGSTGYEYISAITLDNSSNIYVAGHSTSTWGTPVEPFTSGKDVFVAKLTSAGAPIWHTFIGGGGDEIGSAIDIDSSNNIYVGGISDATWGTPLRAYTGGQDGFAAQLSSSGTLSWHAFTGGSGDDQVTDLAVDTNNNVYLGGHSDVDWGTSLRAYGGNIDGFVAKISETVPGAPTGVSATRGNGHATIYYSAPGSDGGSEITKYTASCTDGLNPAMTADSDNGTDLDIVVSSLSNGTTYNCSVTAINAVGTGAASTPAVSVTPMTIINVVDGVQGTVSFSVSGQTFSNLSSAIASGQIPSNIDIPYGLINYTVTSITGGSVTVTLTFSESLPNNFNVYKVDHAGVYTLIPTSLWTQIDANSIAITLTDGGEFDLDGVVNSSIDDPITIGTIREAVTPEPIPSLGEWGLILLSLLLTVFGLMSLRRKQSASLS